MLRYVVATTMSTPPEPRRHELSYERKTKALVRIIKVSNGQHRGVSVKHFCLFDVEVRYVHGWCRVAMLETMVLLIVNSISYEFFSVDSNTSIWKGST